MEVDLMGPMSYGTCGDQLIPDYASSSGRDERWLRQGDEWVIFEHVDRSADNGWVDSGRREPIK